MTLRFRIVLLFAAAAALHAAEPAAKYKVKVIADARIRMRDGVEIAAKITRPDGEGKFPAIMSYNPYRRPGTIAAASVESEYTQNVHGPSYFAERGYVSVDYDVRGTGNSGGSTQDMYADAERQDGYHMVEWIAAQPWSNGNVGMWGLSYGGVDTWQVAAMAPPHLKAIIVRAGTEDTYLDWAYPGGSPRSMFVIGHFSALMTAQNAMPPDPAVTGEKWASIWEEHLQKNVPWSIGMLKHQVEDGYWRARSVRPDYDRIQCAVFVIEGWNDWYQTAELRAFSHLKVPKRALIGPWAHFWPENAFPGPRIDGRREYLKWFDQFLKGIDTGILKEPPVTIFVREYEPPAPMLLEEKGFWRLENEWPPARGESRPMYLGPAGRLDPAPAAANGDRDSFVYNAAVGVTSGMLGRGNVAPWAMPLDQRPDEALALVYTNPPLPANLEATGDPMADLFVSSTADVAYFHVKVCDVAPDGISRVVTDGGWNATRHRSISSPEPLEAGKIYELKFPLKSMAYVFAAGHRIRVDIAGADFQNVWPVAKSGRSTVHRNGKYPSRVILPVVGAQNPRLPEPDLKPSPNPLPGMSGVTKPEYTITMDLIRQTTTMRTGAPNGSASFTVSSANPADATMTAVHTMHVSQEGVETGVQAQSVTTSDEKVFRQLIELEVTVNGKRHFNKSWTVVTPRMLN
jgi:putative CocE/NonD family hydrolase